jgi:two-component system NtrC family response regulator
LAKLAELLLGRFRRGPVTGSSITSEALTTLATHTWPGNVRELANVLEHASILCDAGPIGVEHLPSNFEARRRRSLAMGPIGPMSLKEIEKQAIDQALTRHGGNKPKAADELGVSLKTLYNRLNEQLLKESA